MTNHVLGFRRIPISLLTINVQPDGIILMTESSNLLAGSPNITISGSCAFSQADVQPRFLDDSDFQLRVILNLRRKDGNGENVPMVFTYPVKIVSQAQDCKECILPVLDSELKDPDKGFCFYKQYKEGRISTKQALPNTMNPVFEKTIDLNVFPNPGLYQLKTSPQACIY